MLAKSGPIQMPCCLGLSELGQPKRGGWGNQRSGIASLLDILPKRIPLCSFMKNARNQKHKRRTKKQYKNRERQTSSWQRSRPETPRHRKSKALRGLTVSRREPAASDHGSLGKHIRHNCRVWT